MASLQRALLVIAFLYIFYHIYSYGLTTTNMIAMVLLVVSFILELTRKSRRAKLEAYFARKEAEVAEQEAAAEAAKIAKTTDGAKAGSDDATKSQESVKVSINKK